MSKQSILIFFILLLVVGCHKQEKGQKLTIDMQSNSPLYLITYGANAIDVDTLPLGDRIRWTKPFERDTLDLLLLIDKHADVFLPLFPDSTDIQVKLSSTGLQIKGAVDSESLMEWYQLKAGQEGEISGEHLEFLTKHTGTRLTTLLAIHLLNNSNETPCDDDLKSIANIGFTQEPALKELLGLNHIEFRLSHNVTTFPTELIAGKKRKGTRELLGKKPLFVAVFTQAQDTVSQKKEWAFIEHLDSLGVPTYHALLMTDSLPSEWKVQAKDKRDLTWHYFLLDSAGEATHMAEELKLSHLPTYMIVDTLLQVWRSWESRDKALEFIEKLKEDTE